MVYLAAILVLIWIAWMVQAVLSAIQVRWFAAKVGEGPRPEETAHRPPVSLVLPIKGVDDELIASLEALASQTYPDYRLYFVVESSDDPAFEVLREHVSQMPVAARLLVAGVAPPDQGQKVYNQLRALEELERDVREGEVWVFADSDMVAGADWLWNMVGSLARRDVLAVSTGYRWLVPQQREGDSGASPWSHLASVINSSVACLQGRWRTSQVWGGSMAIPAELAIRGRLRERWTGALTDDYPMTRLAHDLGMKVKFVPRCLVASPVDFGRGMLWNFGYRQYLLTRVYAPWLFALAMTFTWLYTVAFVSAWTWLGYCLYHGPDGWRWKVPLVPMAVVFLANQVRSRYRRLVVAHAFGEDGLRTLRRTLWIDRWLTPVWMAVHGLIVLRSAFGQTMVWRGVRYRLKGPNQVLRLDVPAAA